MSLAAHFFIHTIKAVRQLGGSFHLSFGFNVFRFTHLILALCFVFGFSTEAPAQRATEYEVKAAFLYNFARFVTWPDSAFAQANSPLVIGVFGSNPIGTTLEKTVQGKSIQDHPFIIEQFHSLEDIKTCHILFISPTERSQLNTLLDHVKNKPILTISEQNNFCQMGGMINFILQKRNVRFEMNPDAIDQANLSISSRLLKLAQIVKDE